MKATSLLAILIFSSLGAGNIYSQARGITGGGGFSPSGITVVPKKDPAKKVVKTIQLIAVSPERVWKSADTKQKPIIGSLLAFEREAKTGKVSIVKGNKVRLLVGKKDFTLPLEKLSLDDQAYVQNLEDSARIAGKLIEPPKKKAPEKKTTTAAKKTPK